MCEKKCCESEPLNYTIQFLSEKLLLPLPPLPRHSCLKVTKRYTQQYQSKCRFPEHLRMEGVPIQGHSPQTGREHSLCYRRFCPWCGPPDMTLWQIIIIILQGDSTFRLFKGFEQSSYQIWCETGMSRHTWSEYFLQTYQERKKASLVSSRNWKH